MLEHISRATDRLAVALAREENIEDVDQVVRMDDVRVVDQIAIAIDDLGTDAGAAARRVRLKNGL